MRNIGKLPLRGLEAKLCSCQLIEAPAAVLRPGEVTRLTFVLQAMTAGNSESPVSLVAEQAGALAVFRPKLHVPIDPPYLREAPKSAVLTFLATEGSGEIRFETIERKDAEPWINGVEASPAELLKVRLDPPEQSLYTDPEYCVRQYRIVVSSEGLPVGLHRATITPHVRPSRAAPPDPVSLELEVLERLALIPNPARVIITSTAPKPKLRVTAVDRLGTGSVTVVAFDQKPFGDPLRGGWSRRIVRDRAEDCSAGAGRNSRHIRCGWARARGLGFADRATNRPVRSDSAGKSRMLIFSALPQLGFGKLPPRHGLSLAETLVVIGITGVLAGLLLPAVQQLREKSRQMTCQKNLRDLALAAHAHLSAQGEFPYTSVFSGEIIGGQPVLILESISSHRSLMAYIDPAIYQRMEKRDASFPYDAVRPGSNSLVNQELMKVSIPSFLCPSDSAPVGANNYRANLGIGPGIYHPDIHRTAVGPLDPGNATGAYINGHALRPQDFKDGLSNTAMFSERVVGDGNPEIYTPFRDRYRAPVDITLAEQAIQVCRDSATATPPNGHVSFSGYTWLYGGWGQTWYNHILTPNSRIPDCSEAGIDHGGNGLHTARSFHPGGVNVACADGSIRFVSDSIDLSVWRALSTRAGGESLGD